MRRRSTVDEAVDGEEVPSWVLDAQSYQAAIRELRVTGLDPRDLVAGGTGPVRDRRHARLHRFRQERRERAERWCAERGLSYCMTVLGWRKPSPAEALAGCHRGVGPTYVEAVQRREVRSHG